MIPDARRARLHLVRQEQHQRQDDQDRHGNQRQPAAAFKPHHDRPLFPEALKPRRRRLPRYHLQPVDRAVLMIGTALVLAIVVALVAMARRPIVPAQAPATTIVGTAA